MAKKNNVRTRMAPTPSGTLHLGTAHTALFNWLYAKHHSGQFVLRIDDTDPKRYKKDYEKDIIESLRWLGIIWDEGPDIGGKYGPYRQSERMDHYWSYVQKLLKERKAYLCFCTPEELEKERKEMLAKGIAPKYSGKCRGLSRGKKDKLKKQNKKAAVRLKVGKGKISFVDPSRGKISVKREDIGDFVIARADKTALLALATTVDDIEMKITHTIRGEDYLNFVPKQLLLYEALGVKPPVFAHLAFIYGPDGAKLSKRHGATAVSDYKKMGYLPEALVNYLILLGWSPKDDREILDIRQVIKIFDLKDVNDAGPKFDLKKLDWMNGEYIRQLSVDELSARCKMSTKGGPVSGWQSAKLFGEVENKLLKKIIPLVQDRVKTLNEIENLAGFFFKKPKVDKKLLRKKWQEHLTAALKVLEKIKKWNLDNINKDLMKLIKERGFKTGEFFMNLRIAITGNKVTPPINESVEILGKEETLARLREIVGILE